MSAQDEIIEEGSGNVFADLGFADPDTHLLKAQLVTRVAEAMQERKLTQDLPNRNCRASCEASSAASRLSGF
jgi:hypothetical protein